MDNRSEQAKRPTEGPAPTPLSAVATAVPVGMQEGDALGVNKYIGSGTGQTPLGGVPQQQVFNNPFGQPPITKLPPPRSQRGA